MSENLNEVLKGIYEHLTEEQKEKAKKCETIEELSTLAGKEGIELPDEVLDAVVGGARALPPGSYVYCAYCRKQHSMALVRETTIIPANESRALAVQECRCEEVQRTFYYNCGRNMLYDDSYNAVGSPEGGC